MMKLVALFFALGLVGCAAKAPVIPVDSRSVEPGSSVTRGGTTELSLLGKPIRLDQQVPDIPLVDTHLRQKSLADLKGAVLLVSVVPSLDTKVCERQTHILGEMAGKLPDEVKRITISRDLPFAQKRFAEETGFGEILFLSDFQQSAFGRGTGLLVDQIYLLARAVLVIDRNGLVRYLQIVPELSHLPDMERAIAFARRLAE